MLRIQPYLSLSVALLLAACGGGGGTASLEHQVQAPSIAVGEPAPNGPAKAEFIKLALGAECTEFQNRLFVIDNKQVLWTSRGNCPDRGFINTLYGMTPKDVLCSTADSIGGPQTRCNDEVLRLTLDTAMRNLEVADLGLGKDHQVVALAIAADGPRAFDVVLTDTYAGDLLAPAAQHQVIRDPAAYRKLWDAHHSYMTNPPAIPAVDFSKKMLISAAIGNRSSGCYSVKITDVSVKTGKLIVSYVEGKPSADSMCTMSFTSPMQLIQLDRLDGEAEFVSK